MYAIVEKAGQQYKVQEGDTLLVDHLKLAEGATFEFDQVLARDGEIGTPAIKGAKVSATVLEPLVKAKKVYTLKYRRRKASSKSLKGHRQQYTRIRIEKIS